MLRSCKGNAIAFEADGRGLEYLFGVVYKEGGEDVFRGFCARNPDEEKRGFAALVDFLQARLAQYPDLQVYH